MQSLVRLQFGRRGQAQQPSSGAVREHCSGRQAEGGGCEEPEQIRWRCGGYANAVHRRDQVASSEPLRGHPGADRIAGSEGSGRIEGKRMRMSCHGPTMALLPRGRRRPPLPRRDDEQPAIWGGRDRSPAPSSRARVVAVVRGTRYVMQQRSSRSDEHPGPAPGTSTSAGTTTCGVPSSFALGCRRHRAPRRGTRAAIPLPPGVECCTPGCRMRDGALRGSVKIRPALRFRPSAECGL